MEKWVNVSDLRFTNPDIASMFQRFPDLSVSDAVIKIRNGLMDPLEKFQRVTVHEDNEGVLWCENNRTLYVLRMAGVRQFKAKITRNDFMSRRYGEEEKTKRNDPDFLPKIRRESEVSSLLPLVYGRSPLSNVLTRVGSGPSPSEMCFEETSGTVVTGLLAVAAGALLVGYGSWKLYKSAQKL